MNPSYVLFGAVLFWVGAVEAAVFPDAPLLPKRLADYLQGFGIAWVLQLHLSWTLLVPFAGFAWIARARRGEGVRALAAFALGCATTGSLLVPTLITHDLAQIGNTGIAVSFNPINARDFGSIAAKVLSFASYELPRFIGSSNRNRLAWIASDWRVTPFAFFSVAIGLLQPIAMLLLWFRRQHALPGWTATKALAAATILLTWTAFLFTLREPWALTIYLTLPIAFLYSLYCYAWFLKGERWRLFAALVLVSGLVTEVALARRNFETRSLYLDRERPARAIAERDYRILGERRPGTLY